MTYFIALYYNVKLSLKTVENQLIYNQFILILTDYDSLQLTYNCSSILCEILLHFFLNPVFFLAKFDPKDNIVGKYKLLPPNFFTWFSKN